MTRELGTPFDPESGDVDCEKDARRVGCTTRTEYNLLVRLLKSTLPDALPASKDAFS